MAAFDAYLVILSGLNVTIKYSDIVMENEAVNSRHLSRFKQPFTQARHHFDINGRKFYEFSIWRYRLM